MTSVYVCYRHAHPESQLCHDCGVEAWLMDEDGQIAHEDFYVADQLWNTVCPDDAVEVIWDEGIPCREGTFVLCIGCFEARLGRRLTREDFEVRPKRRLGVPP
ncbi:MAG: hypothetical protein WCA93_11475, partial [Acidimicrobiia bacterium]